jgi:hypothetical protein
VEPPVFDLDQGLASSFDWLINWFNGTMADAIEEAVEETINGQLAPTVKLLFESLSDYEETFEVPPFLGATQAVPVGVKVQPAFLSLDPTGGLAALSVSASAQKGPSWLTSPGSLAREGCLDSVETSVDLPTDAPLVMAIHDDVVNQGLFGAWWGGVLHVTVDESLLTTLEVELPIDEIDAQLDPMLPPVLTSCTSNGKPQLHVGDLRILTTFLLNGELAAVEAYASAAFEVEMTAAAAPGATIDLGLGLQNVVWLDFELVSVSGAIQGRQDILQVLIEGLVSEVLANALSNGVFQQFPVPQLAIGTFVPGLPANAALGFIPESLVRKQGYTILSGKVAQN